jgi:hypothetical protein
LWLSDVSLWFVLLWLLDLRENRKLMRLTRWLTILYLVFIVLDALTFLGFGMPNPVPAQIVDACCTVVTTTAELLPFCIIAVAVFRRRPLATERWVVAGLAFVTQTIFVSGYAFLEGSRFTHWTLGETISAPLFTVAGSPVNAQTVAGLLLIIALVYAVYQYSAENSRRQAALEEEYKNARAVQQLLIPAAIPAVAGFAIESVYKPAREVGGDFFQVLPDASDGSVLVVVGDVAGKGLQAGMLATLVVGAVRVGATFTNDPGKILALLNDRLQGRGLVTCLALRIEQDGKATLANAGHLAPYLNGKEFDMEGALPLGAIAGVEYPATHFKLSEGDSLMLMSDGIVEAQNAEGKLFGFERIGQMLKDKVSALGVADAAQSFGQEDDITVLTLLRTVPA